MHVGEKVLTKFPEIMCTSAPGACIYVWGRLNESSGGIVPKREKKISTMYVVSFVLWWSVFTCSYGYRNTCEFSTFLCERKSKNVSHSGAQVYALTHFKCHSFWRIHFYILACIYFMLFDFFFFSIGVEKLMYI